jgi:hypothetical protein
LREQSQRESRLQKAKSILQEEPKDDRGVTRIRFVLPSGKKVIRKFAADERVSVLRAFLTLYFHDNNMAEMPNIGLSTAFPKKCFDHESDEQLTLREAGLSPQAVLMVQDLDA